MMRAVARLGLVSTLLLAAACAGIGTSRPLLPAPGERPIPIESRATPLGPVGATLAEGITYAGGLTLRGPDLHGLSDLKIDGDTAWIVSDFGSLIRLRLLTETTGRLTGATAATARPLVDTDGSVLTPKPRADAEGIAILDDGSVLVSFERDHRIWNYGRNGQTRPVPMPQPDAEVPDNAGMEGLATAGADGWLVLSEAGGGWTCQSTGCAPLPAYPEIGEDGFRVTGADRDPAGGWFVVERYFSPPLSMRARVRRLADDGTPGPVLIELRPPASVDNMEGIAAVETPTGTRLYLLSDDNDNPLQRTLLLAFDLKR